ncbi:MAG: hypothetical protein HY511_07835 [Actinobacteria bacterium]|nr:hypothetical protein [Actinomycetota bacterium]
MSAAEVEIRESELERIEGWRTGELLRAGYDHDAASELAGRLDVDLHTAIDLVRHGCPADLALKILL